MSKNYNERIEAQKNKEKNFHFVDYFAGEYFAGVDNAWLFKHYPDKW